MTNHRFLTIITLWLGLVLRTAPGLAAPAAETHAAHAVTIPLPPAGCMYHGVHPAPLSAVDERLLPEDLASYEITVGKKAAWVDLSQHWGTSRTFPATTAAWIQAAGSIPFIRLMFWSAKEENKKEPVFTVDAVVRGVFDADLRAWARGARDYGAPLIASFGPEVNGRWYPWNGTWNGGGAPAGYGDPAYPDGPERFRDAYRRIITIMRREGAANITWVFHVNYNDWPLAAWNRLENYYPGDGYIDWLAVSIYGAQQPAQEHWPEFAEIMEPVYRRLQKLARTKPVVVAEFGVAAGTTGGSQAQWAQQALAGLTRGRWPRVIGFAWWNAAWQNDANPLHDTTMRVQDNPSLAAVFKKYVGDNPQILARIAP